MNQLSNCDADCHSDSSLISETESDIENKSLTKSTIPENVHQKDQKKIVDEKRSLIYNLICELQLDQPNMDFFIESKRYLLESERDNEHSIPIHIIIKELNFRNNSQIPSFSSHKDYVIVYINPEELNVDDEKKSFFVPSSVIFKRLVSFFGEIASNYSNIIKEEEKNISFSTQDYDLGLLGFVALNSKGNEILNNDDNLIHLYPSQLKKEKKSARALKCVLGIPKLPRESFQMKDLVQYHIEFSKYVNTKDFDLDDLFENNPNVVKYLVLPKKNKINNPSNNIQLILWSKVFPDEKFLAPNRNPYYKDSKENKNKDSSSICLTGIKNIVSPDHEESKASSHAMNLKDLDSESNIASKNHHQLEVLEEENISSIDSHRSQEEINGFMEKSLENIESASNLKIKRAEISNFPKAKKKKNDQVEENISISNLQPYTLRSELSSCDQPILLPLENENKATFFSPHLPNSSYRSSLLSDFYRQSSFSNTISPVKNNRLNLFLVIKILLEDSTYALISLDSFYEQILKYQYTWVMLQTSFENILAAKVYVKIFGFKLDKDNPLCLQLENPTSLGQFLYLPIDYFTFQPI